MAKELPSSNASTDIDEKGREAMNGSITAHDSDVANKNKRLSSDLERVKSPDQETEANIFAEREGLAEADLEKNAAEPPKPTVGGVNPADFPDGGLEAWLVGDIHIPTLGKIYMILDMMLTSFQGCFWSMVWLVSSSVQRSMLRSEH